MNRISQITIQTVLAVTATFFLGACTSMDDGANLKSQGSGMSQEFSNIKDTKVGVDFTDEGVKVFYTTFGNVERIEVYGQAPVWKVNYAVIAEADAMDKLLKFVYGQSVSSNKKVEIITKALDIANDDLVKSHQSIDGGAMFTKKQIETTPSPNPSSDSQESKNKRIAKTVDQTVTATVSSMIAQGRLTAVRKVRDEVLDGGKQYVAVYQWSKKDQASASYIRSLMK